MRALRMMRRIVAGDWKLTMTDWAQSSELELILLQLHKKTLKNSTLTLLQSFSIWGKSERWKSLISGCPMSWLKIWKKKHCNFEVSSFLVHNNNEPYLDWIVMCDESGWYMTIGNNKLSGWTEKKLQCSFQSQTCTKKRSWSLFGGLLPVWPTIVFWILAKVLHLRIMLSKSMSIPENWNTCSQHWSTEWAQFFSTITPNHTWHNQGLKRRMNWSTKFCLILHIHLTSHQPTTTSSSILRTFLLGKCFHNHQQNAENAFQEFTESQSMDFYATGVSKLISCWQKCVDCNGSLC